jgi:hypothetical protein
MLRRPFIVASGLAVVALSLLVAGCGSGRSPSVASVGSSTTAATATTAQSGLIAFSNCMRVNGAPNFPDPQRLPGGSVKLAINQAAATSPKFNDAMKTCNHLLPNRGSEPQESAQQQRKHLADALSFAKCMRSHGVTRFPDPTAQGQLTVEMVQAAGIDVHSPTVLRVVQACLPASHGALTPAKVREALANASS